MKRLFSAQPVDVGSGRVSTALFRLALPSMISLFFQNLYSLVDTMFVSWVGTTALAALSLSVPVFYVALALAKGIGIGTTTLMSNARGEGNTEKADAMARYSLTLMLLVLCPLLIFALPGPCREIFTLLGARGEVRVEVYDYALWLALSFPVMGYVILCEGVFMSHGDSVTPMKGMLLGNIVNLVFDPLLIFGAGLGVGGASLASLLGWLVTALYLRARLVQSGFVRPAWIWTPQMFPIWRAIWALGYLIALSMLVIPFSFGTMNWLLARFGPAPLGAWNLMSRVELMVVLPFMGICNALVPFLGFNRGRRDWGRIRDSIRVSLLIEISGMVFFAILFLLFSRQIMAVFRPEPEVVRWGSYALRASATAYALFPFELTLMGAAQGLRRPAYSLAASAARQLGFRIPLAVLLSRHWGAHGIFWSHPAAMALSGILCIFLIKDLLKRTFAEVSGDPAAEPRSPSLEAV